MKNVYYAQHPFALVDGIFSTMEQLLGDEPLLKRNLSHTIPTDIKDMGTYYLVESELPGYTKEHIQVEYKDGILSIKATNDTKKVEKEETKEEGTYLYQGRKKGTLSCSYQLKGIDENNIKATYENGILTLHLPKWDQTSTKQIIID